MMIIYSFVSALGSILPRMQKMKMIIIIIIIIIITNPNTS